jgi:beta-lactamase class A
MRALRQSIFLIAFLIIILLGVSCEKGRTPSLQTPTGKSIDEYAFHQKAVTKAYQPLKQRMEQIVLTANGSYSVYFEDLTSGAHIGVHENERFQPKSLFKVPAAAAVLKAIEEDKFSLQDTVTLTPEMLDDQFGTLYKKGAGYNVTMSELLRLSLTESDNTANSALYSVVSGEDLLQAFFSLGIPYPAQNTVAYSLSPQEYAAILRSLYFSGYLHEPYSEYILALLKESTHTKFIRAGVPSPVPVAHKIGVDTMQGEYHDCGIVYHPQQPYILCIMSGNTTETEAMRVLSEVSAVVYDEVSVVSLGN